MNTTEYANVIVGELGETLNRISSADGEKLTEYILNAKKVIVAGAGRSGFTVKAFAMRLMHMGFDAYVAGETVTPNLEPEDLLIIGSGSGETGSLVHMAHKAKKIGAGVAAVTILPQGTIGRISDLAVQIPAPTPKADTGNFSSAQPMGSLFEQSLLIFLDAVIMRLMEKQGITSEAMFERHANLE